MDWVLIVQIITFVVFMWILYRLGARPIAGVLRQRSDRIAASLRSAAESERRAAEIQQETRRQIEQARGEAQSILDSARKAAEVQRQALLEQARSDAAALLQRARDGIERERQAAIDELRREAGRLAVIAATRVVGSALDETANRALADRTIVEVGGVR